MPSLIPIILKSIKMKKLIVVALLVLSFSGIAQERKGQHHKGNVDLTPQQSTELQVKKLTLELDLNAKQQKEIAEIINKQQVKRTVMREQMKAKREEVKKRNADEKFARKSQILDQRIAMKTEMKKILTPEQAQKWEKMQMRKMKTGTKKMHQGARFQK